MQEPYKKYQQKDLAKKSDEDYAGRTAQNSMVVFPKGNAKRGTLVEVKILECTSMTLKGELVD